MSDELDSLNGAQLSEVFCEEVVCAGWQTIMTGPDANGQNNAEVLAPVGWKNEGFIFPPVGKVHRHFLVPGKRDFATSADAALPFLEKCHVEIAHLLTAGWLIHVRKSAIAKEYFIGKSLILASAACIALIRAKRAQKP